MQLVGAGLLKPRIVGIGHFEGRRIPKLRFVLVSCNGEPAIDSVSTCNHTRERCA